jgi:hypothetical protein
VFVRVGVSEGVFVRVAVGVGVFVGELAGVHVMMAMPGSMPVAVSNRVPVPSICSRTKLPL